MNRLMGALALTAMMQANAGAREAEWKAVEEAVAQGLPRTAIERLEPIVAGAMADRAWAEAIKAVALRVTYEGQIEGNRPEEKIPRLQAELDKAPAEMVPVFEGILAHWYWHYFQQNRWRFLERTVTAEAPGEDFTTWDLRRLFAEIDRRFERALAAEATLKGIPVADYDALLTRGNTPDRYRPTLYDFLAHEALAFFTSGEQAGARPQDAFEVAATDPIFDAAEGFLGWDPVTTETEAPALRAIRLFQALLRFHGGAADRSAFLDVDLARLRWGRNVAYGEETGERYEAALRRLAEENEAHELASLALWHLGQAVWERGEPAEAHALARRGRDRHPESVGGRLCAGLIEQIEAPSASIATERVWNPPWPEIRVTYRNLDRVWFRAIPWEWNEVASGALGSRHWLSVEQRQALLRRTPALSWNHPLPVTTDYRERTEALPAPAGLKPGSYFVVASHREDFGEETNQLAMVEVWVSEVGLVLRQGGSALEGIVVHAGTGEPLAGAWVEAWTAPQRGRPERLERVAQGTVDALGGFRLSWAARRAAWVRVVHQGQSLVSADFFYTQDTPRERASTQSFLFTDRALYRPGQTVHYKGIAVRIDRERNDYETLKRQALTVAFLDPNGKEIARQRHAVNEYGSFSGSFTAPADRVAGRMSLQVVEGPEGSGWVQVEEYKRPRFQVTLEAPAEAPKLDEPVRLSGEALAYTGAAVDRAPVKWRVTREVRMPWWWGVGWRGGWPLGEAAEVAHGTAETGVDGRFTIEFVARPDRRVPEKDQPSFVYRISADVTDGAGETRSAARTVRVGYVALEAQLSAPEWLTPAEPVGLEVRTTTLDGEPQARQGVVRVHALEAPDSVRRPPLGGGDGPWPMPPRPRGARVAGGDPAPPDLSDPRHWPLGAVVRELSFATDAAGKAALPVPLEAGVYRAMIATTDRFGKEVTGQIDLRVLDPAGSKLTLKVPHLLAAPTWSIEPGGEFLALWGTGYDQGRALVEIEHRGRVLERYWTPATGTQTAIRHRVTEALRGGFTLRLTYVRENRAYLESRVVEVPWSDRELTLRWERFRSRLDPGQAETWSLVVAGKDAAPRVAELAATLYDASLDAYLPHGWPSGFPVFWREQPRARSVFANRQEAFQVWHSDWGTRRLPVAMPTYRSFPPELTAPPMLRHRVMLMSARGALPSPAAADRMHLVDASMAPSMAPGAPGDLAFGMEKAAVEGLAADRLEAGIGGGAGEPPAAGPDLSQVSARRNLNETAFFFPHLTSDTNGVVRLTFTMPEALTEWRFLGFAHDAALRAGRIEARTVTAKDLMVQPNPPRFLREGDTLEFTVKVTNLGESRQQGRIRLNLSEALTDAGVDVELGNTTPEQTFDVPAKESRTHAWRLQVPDGMGPLVYRAVAASATVSDGEEGMLPVLARRVLVTESLPLPIRGPGERRFRFERLIESGKSDTLRHQSVTLQMVSNPAWYAVMALPYLMEYPHESSDQLFNRLYANALARFVAGSDPRIRRVFDLWKNTPALDSPLEKNAGLKSVLLEETPWWRQAQDESQARRQVGILFDQNRLNHELERAHRQLIEAQHADGTWPWFPGGPSNDTITLRISAGFGRLRHLGVEVDVSPALRALDRLDTWLQETYDRIRRDDRLGGNNLNPRIALQLYGRGFFLQDKPVAEAQQEAFAYFLDQARRHWVELDNRQSQGYLALALGRFGDQETPAAIVRSLKERSVTSEELGRFWRDTERSWWWYRAPIETQALMIEVFAEVARDMAAVDECQTWLLKQKQTQNWKTTRATADAVYALLLRGRNLLASDRLVEVELGGVRMTPAVGRDVAVPRPDRGPAPEPGTGYYERRFTGGDIRPELGEVVVLKADEGVAWGGLHWQYFEDVDKVEAYAGTPLTLALRVYRKEMTGRGPELREVGEALAVGDELVLRLELRVDRDMEYVHLKLPRGSGTEPVNVLSGYRYQDGLAYYETTRDTATHCFIDYLPRGTYVFEQSVRVQHRGEYATGLASIQCLYAPEFNSHSASVRLRVQHP